MRQKLRSLSVKAAEQVITGMKSEADPAGTVYGKLKLRSARQTKTSVKLSWTKVSGAKKYVIYGSKCGKTTKPKKIGTYTAPRRR